MSTSSVLIIAVCFCTFALQLPVGSAKKRHCQLCSDVNVETHYGSFFRNPREKQPSLLLSSAPLKCSSQYSRLRIQTCDDYCFILQVTSQHIGTNESMVFGEARGCSTSLLPKFDRQKKQCHSREVQLLTEPRFDVQAEYCLCQGDYCNRRPTKTVTLGSFDGRAPDMRSFGTRADDVGILSLLSLFALFLSSSLGEGVIHPPSDGQCKLYHPTMRFTLAFLMVMSSVGAMTIGNHPKFPALPNHPDLKSCNYCADQDFYEDALGFVTRQVTERKTRSKYISGYACSQAANSQGSVLCLNRCFTMVSEYTENGIEKRSEVRSCEALHFSSKDTSVFEQNGCQHREYKGKKQTICFCKGDQCNFGINGFTNNTTPTTEVPTTARSEAEGGTVVPPPGALRSMVEDDNAYDFPFKNVAKKVVRFGDTVPLTDYVRITTTAKPPTTSTKSGNGVTYDLGICIILVVPFIAVAF